MLNIMHYKSPKERFLYGYFVLFLAVTSIGGILRFLVGQYTIAILDICVILIVLMISLDYEKRHDVNLSALLLFWVVSAFLFYYIFNLGYGLEIIEIILVPLAASILLNTKTFLRHGAVFLLLFALLLSYGFMHKEEYPYLQDDAFIAVSTIIFLFAMSFSMVYHKSTNQFYDRLEKSNTLLAQANEEKTYLLQEIHHRVKNNLNLMTSILGLQAPEDSSTEIQDFVKQNTLRIKSIALVHELLYQSEDLGNVDFNVYVDKLMTHILSLTPNKKINVSLETNNIYFESNTIIHLGIILNELINNSLKYAFPDNKGKIMIRLRKEDHYILDYADSGMGKKEEDTYTEGFGLKLLNLSTRQLQGTLQMHNKESFDCSIYFKGKDI